ncbi:MAG: hypothetical protein WC508_02675 [Patescibacteria group bacterium]
MMTIQAQALPATTPSCQDAISAMTPQNVASIQTAVTTEKALSSGAIQSSAALIQLIKGTEIGINAAQETGIMKQTAATATAGSTMVSKTAIADAAISQAFLKAPIDATVKESTMVMKTEIAGAVTSPAYHLLALSAGAQDITGTGTAMAKSVMKTPIISDTATPAIAFALAT